MQHDISIETTTMGCNRCGAPVVVTDLVASLTCSFCGSTEEIDPRWLNAAARYRGALRAHLDRLSNIRLATHYKTHAGWSKATLLKALPAAGAITAVSVWAVVSPDRFQPWMVLPATLILAAAMIIGSTIHQRRTAARHRCHDLPQQGSEVYCPSCGSALEIAAGSVLQTCTHCGASLLKHLHEISRSYIALAVQVRRQAAALRGVAPYWREHEFFDRSLRDDMLRDPHGPWSHASRLASALRGHDASDHLAWWLAAYWPEATSSFGGSFVWGHWRGYPVGLQLLHAPESGQFVLLGYFAAVVTYTDEVKFRCREVDVYPSLAGFHLRWRSQAAPKDVMDILNILDEVCGRALHDGHLPAPRLDPSTAGRQA